MKKLQPTPIIYSFMAKDFINWENRNGPLGVGWWKLLLQLWLSSQHKGKKCKLACCNFKEFRIIPASLPCDLRQSFRTSWDHTVLTSPEVPAIIGTSIFWEQFCRSPCTAGVYRDENGYCPRDSLLLSGETDSPASSLPGVYFWSENLTPFSGF